MYRIKMITMDLRTGGFDEQFDFGGCINYEVAVKELQKIVRERAADPLFHVCVIRDFLFEVSFKMVAGENLLLVYGVEENGSEVDVYEQWIALNSEGGKEWNEVQRTRT